MQSKKPKKKKKLADWEEKEDLATKAPSSLVSAVKKAVKSKGYSVAASSAMGEAYAFVVTPSYGEMDESLIREALAEVEGAV